MKPIREWSTRGQLAAAVGVLLLLGGLMEGLQRLAGPVEGPTPRAVAAGDPGVLLVPEVFREDDRTVRVRFGNQKTGISTSDRDSADALEACVRDGLEQAFADAKRDGSPITAARTDRRRGRVLVKQVTESCLGLIGVPRPAPPEPPASID